ncbi:MAG: hypothetical protein ACYTGH_19055 [Planctomycetota bacterium]
MVVAPMAMAQGVEGLIQADASTVLRPVKNTMASIKRGDPILYDNPVIPSGGFNGVYEINFTLDKDAFSEGVEIEVLVKKDEPEAEWQVIKTVSPGPKPNGIWTVRSYWNAREEGWIYKGALHVRLQVKKGVS